MGDRDLRSHALVVRCLTDSDRPRWDAFVNHTPAAGFFHQSAWAELLESCFGFRAYFLYAERGGRIEGVLPLSLVESWLTKRALVSLPFCVEAGAVALNPDARAALENEARLIARQVNADHLLLRNRHCQNPDWPTETLYVRFEKALLPTPEENFLAIPRKQRAMVRKGEANGLSATEDADLSRFFPLYANTLHRHGSPALSRRYFEYLKKTFGSQLEVLTVCDAGAKPVSSVLSFYFRDTVLPYYAGDRVEARGLYANDFKYWALMQRAVARGVKRFDYGRSKRGSGPYHFKKNWGFEPSPLFYEYCLMKGQTALPAHHPNNPRYRRMIEAWKRLPLSLATFLGPHVARHFV